MLSSWFGLFCSFTSLTSKEAKVSVSALRIYSNGNCVPNDPTNLVLSFLKLNSKKRKDEQGICPGPFFKPAIDWQLEDQKGKPIEKVREIRDEIERHVKKLITDENQCALVTRIPNACSAILQRFSSPF